MDDRIILQKAHSAWLRLAPFRSRRRRYARFTYGDQWGDPATDRSGNVTTEGELATIGGRRPLANNLIRRLVKSVVGRFRYQRSEGELAAGLEPVYSMNRMDELDARTLEEFLISGAAVHYVSAERRPGGDGVWVDPISPDRFFVNAVSDPRGNDIELIGCLRDMSLGELLMRYAGGDRGRAAMLRKLYGSFAGGGGLFDEATGTSGCTFYHASGDRCRVIEVWTLECCESLLCHDRLNATVSRHSCREQERLDALNAFRHQEGLAGLEVKWELSAMWKCRHFAPDGTVLAERLSPLHDGGHPFAVKLYPLVDGDVHSLVEDVIDQQKYVNRLIALMDNIMGSAAKGVLLFPVKSKVKGIDWETMGKMWSDPRGLLPYNPMPGVPAPQQVVTPVGDIGVNKLLETEMKLFEDVSGVGSALLGKSLSGTVGAERFESEVRNATVSINDLMETFADFTRRRDSLIEGLGKFRGT